MKSVEIYDQYRKVFDTDGVTLLHPSSGMTIKVASGLDDSTALAKVQELYEASKVLGSNYSDKIIQLDRGYAELVIDFPDKRSLNRVIYTV